MQSSQECWLDSLSQFLKCIKVLLKNDLEKADRDKETLAALYDNYIRQMQTLITQKAIEAPGAKKPWWKIW